MDKAINYDINFIKNKYGIFFENYSIAIFHPVTTEYDNFHIYSKNFVDALLESWEKFIVIYPNSDKWSEYIFLEYKRLENSKNMLLFPSIRFEYFLALLYNSNYIIWNSSSWIKEAPYYWIKSIDIWTRQSNRYDKNHTTIIHSWYEKKDILNSILKIKNKYGRSIINNNFWYWNSDKLFFEILKNKDIFNISYQKKFFKNNNNN